MTINPFILHGEEITPVRKLLYLKAFAGGGALSEYELTGNPVAFNTNVAKLLSAFTIPFLPVQAGSGDPSPQNQRPISGWQGLTPYRSGVNVWDEEVELGGINSSTGQPYAATGAIRAKNYIPVVPGASYYLKAPSMARFTGCWYDKDKNYISTTYQVNSVKPAPNNAYFFRFGLPSSYGTTYNHDISINYPSTETEYAPYTGQSYPVTFPDGQTVYGGTLDAVNGVLTVEWASVDLGTLGWVKDNTRFYTAYLKDVIKRGASARSLVMYCSDLYCVSDGRQASNVPDYSIYEGGNGNVFVHDSDYSDKDEFKEAMSGVILCYPLATPYEIPLSDIPVPVTLIGDNTIWTDTNGENTVKYLKKG